MKKEHIMDAMDHIDPALIAAADAPASRRGRTGRVRYGVIAACLCLALVGTAVATQYFGVQIVKGDGGDDADIWMKGGIAYYPVDSLSEDVLALDDPSYSARNFDSWDAMEEFIGVNLMDNPVLDACPAENYIHEWHFGGTRAAGQFLAIGSAGLSQIRTIGCYEIGSVNISVESFLFTNRQDAGGWDERFLGYSFADGVQIDQEAYTAPSGLETQIMKTGQKCRAVFSLKGIPFVVTTDSGRDLEANREVLLQVLDGFVIN